MGRRSLELLKTFHLNRYIMVTPKVNSSAQKELEKSEAQLNAFEDQIKNLTKDRLDAAPVQETEPQTKMSTREANKADAPYIKPVRSINSKEPFNEKYREQHTKSWEYVRCIVENEIVGEQVEVWTRRYAGDPAHFWKVPVNKPIYIPRLLAEQLAQCKYHRLMMETNSTQVTGSDQMGTYVGAMVVDHTKHRIDCRPVGFGFTAMGF